MRSALDNLVLNALQAAPPGTATLQGEAEIAGRPEEDLPSATARLEAMLIRRALARSGGNRAEAARALGIHRQLLYAKIRRYGLDPSAERTDGVGETDR
jgi:DNA-binding NtrC family response regulator